MVFLIPKSILQNFLNLSSQQTDPNVDNSISNCFVPAKKDQLDPLKKEKHALKLPPTYSSYLYEWTSTFVSNDPRQKPAASFLTPEDTSQYGKYYQVGGVFGNEPNNSSERPMSQRWEGKFGMTDFTNQLKNSGFRLMEVTFPANADPNKIPLPVSDPNRNVSDYSISPPPPPPELKSDQPDPLDKSNQPDKPNEQVNTPAAQ